MDRLKRTFREIGSDAQSILSLTTPLKPLISTSQDHSKFVSIAKSHHQQHSKVPLETDVLMALTEDDSDEDENGMKIIQQRLVEFNESDASKQLSRRISQLSGGSRKTATKNVSSNQSHSLNLDSSSQNNAFVETSSFLKSALSDSPFKELAKLVNALASGSSLTVSQREVIESKIAQITTELLSHIDAAKQLELSFRNSIAEKNEKYNQLHAAHSQEIARASATETKYKSMLNQAHQVVQSYALNYKKFLDKFETHLNAFGTCLTLTEDQHGNLSQSLISYGAKLASTDMAQIMSVLKMLIYKLNEYQELYEELSVSLDIAFGELVSLHENQLCDLRSECTKLSLENKALKERDEITACNNFDFYKQKWEESDLEREELVSRLNQLDQEIATISQSLSMTQKERHDLEILNLEYSEDIQRLKLEKETLMRENEELFMARSMSKRIIDSESGAQNYSLQSAEIKDKEESWMSEKVGLEITITSLNKKILEITTENEASKNNIEELQEKLSTISLEKTQLEFKISSLSRDHADEKDSLETEVKTINGMLELLNEEKRQLELEMQEIRDSNEILKLSTASDDNDSSEINARIEDLVQNNAGLEKRVSELEAKLSGQDVEITRLMSENQSLTTANILLREKETALETQVKALSDQQVSDAAAIDRKLAEKDAELKRVKAERDSILSKYAVLSRHTSKMGSLLNAIPNEQEQISELAKNYETVLNKLSTERQKHSLTLSEKKSLDEMLTIRDSEISLLRSELNDSVRREKHSQESLESLQLEFDNLRNAILEKQSQADVLQENLDEQHQSILRLESELCENQQVLKSKNDELELLRFRIQELSTIEASQTSSLKEDSNRLQNENQVLENELKACKMKIQAEESNCKSSSEALAFAQNTIQRLEEMQGFAALEMDQMQVRNTELEKVFAEKENEIQNLQALILCLKSKVFDISRANCSKMSIFEHDISHKLSLMQSSVLKTKMNLSLLSSDIKNSRALSANQGNHLEKILIEREKQIALLSSSFNELSEKLTLKNSELSELSGRFAREKTLNEELRASHETLEMHLKSLSSKIAENEIENQTLYDKLSQNESSAQLMVMNELQLQSRVQTLEVLIRDAEQGKSKLAKEKESLKSQLKDVEQKLLEMRETKGALEIEIDDLREQRELDAKHLLEADAELEDLRDRYESLTFEIERKDEVIEIKETAIAKLCDEITTLKGLIEDKNCKITCLTKELESISFIQNRKELSIESLQKDLDESLSLQEKVFAALKTSIEKFQLKWSPNLLENICILERFIVETRAEMSVRNDELSQKIEQTTKLLHDGQQKLLETEHKLLQTMNAKEHSEAQLSKLSSKSDKYERNLKEKSKQMDLLKSELESCKSMIAQLPQKYEMTISQLQNELQKAELQIHVLKESETTHCTRQTDVDLLRDQLSVKNGEISALNDELELKKGECLLVNMQNEDLQKRIADLEASAKSLESIMAESEKKYQATLDSVSADMANIKADSERFEKMNNELFVSNEELQESLASAREEVGDLQRNCAKAEIEKRQLVEELKSLRSKCTVFEHTVNRLSDEIEQWKSKAGDLQISNTVKESLESVDAKLHADKNALTERLQNLEGQLKKYEAARQVYKKKIGSLQTDLDSRNQLVSQLQNQVSSLSRDNQEMSKSLKNYTADSAVILDALKDVAIALRVVDDEPSRILETRRDSPLKETDLISTKSQLRSSTNENFRNSTQNVSPRKKQPLGCNLNFATYLNQMDTNGKLGKPELEGKIQKLLQLVDNGAKTIETGSELIRSTNSLVRTEKEHCFGNFDEKENALFEKF